MVMGDFNAVLHPEDRTGPSDPADELHRSECAALNLTPMGNALPGRPHTFRKSQCLLSPPVTSRIDDILVWNRPSNHPHPPMPEVTLEPGGNLDHMALRVNLPSNLIPNRNPSSLDPSRTTHEPSLAMPIKKSELLETSDKIKTDINIHDLWTVVREYKLNLLNLLKGDHSAQNVNEVSVALRDSQDSHTRVDQLGDALNATINTTLQQIGQPHLHETLKPEQGTQALSLINFRDNKEPSRCHDRAPH